MKKISAFLSVTITLTGFIFITSCNNSASSAASNFEGVVTYEVQAGPGMPPEYASMFKGVTMKTFVKGTLCRSEEGMGGSESIIIADSKKPDDPTRLVSMFGHKYAVKLDDSMKKIAAQYIPEIEYIDSANTTKQIAGYTCEKAKITVNVPHSGPVTSYLYYTTDLPYADPEDDFRGLKGMPMEFSINMGGVSITISAKSVEKKSLPDSLFTIPADYKQMSIADMKKDLMKNMPTDSTATPHNSQGDTN